MKTIAIHQPNYLPWLGFFYKIFLSDIFVFLDDVEFTKQSFTRRVYIRKEKKSIEKSYLIIPLQRHSDASLIKDLLMDHSQDWQTRQLNQVFNTYSKAPFFEETYSLFKSWMDLAKDFISLAAYNQYLIEAISGLLGCQVNFKSSSKCSVQRIQGERNLELVQYFGAQIYLSGQGGKKYQGEALFKKAQIKIEYADMYKYLEEKRYTQRQGEWLNGLTIIDALMNLGATGIVNLYKDYGNNLLKL